MINTILEGLVFVVKSIKRGAWGNKIEVCEVEWSEVFQCYLLKQPIHWICDATVTKGLNIDVGDYVTFKMLHPNATN